VINETYQATKLRISSYTWEQIMWSKTESCVTWVFATMCAYPTLFNARWKMAQSVQETLREPLGERRIIVWLYEESFYKEETVSHFRTIHKQSGASILPK
jgi:hypothetical protein